MTAVEAAAAMGDSRTRLTRIIRGTKKVTTLAHQQTVMNQFLMFLSGRTASAELYQTFMVRDMESKKKDGSPAYAASSLWSRRTHLRDYFKTLNPPLDVSSVDSLIYDALSALKRGQQPSHAREFKSTELFDFWARAPNEGMWLLYKAISLIGFYGLARNSELVGLTWNNVHIDDAGIWILLHRVKCPKDGDFTKVLIPRATGHRIVPADIFLTFRNSILAARLSNMRLWMQWRRGKWVNQALGKESVRKVPGIVAEFLFPGQNNEGFRGHSWRPSGATALAEFGGSVLQLQSAGHWQSVQVATSYVHESESNHKQIAIKMCGESSQPETDDGITEQAPQPDQNVYGMPPCKIPKMVFNAPVTGCTFNVYCN